MRYYYSIPHRLAQGCFLCFVLLISQFMTPAFGQTTIADWTYGTSAAPTTTDPHATVPSALYTTTPTTPSISGSRFRAQGWNVSSLDLTRYFEVSITPNASYSLTATQFLFNVQNTGAAGAPNQYAVAVSTDNFTTSSTLGSGAVTGSPTTITLPVTTVVGVVVKTTFRIYFWGATDATRFVSIGRTTITGTVLAPVLPVTLISFKGQAAGNTVILNWSTASEQASEQFAVQRSSDASEFVSIGTRQSAGTTDRQQYYSLTDEEPNNGLNYYRLQQVDRDGSVVYSKPIAVRVDASLPYASLLENPTDGQTVQLKLYQMEAPQVRLSALTGQAITGQLTHSSTTEAVFTPTSPLSPGLYVLTVQEGATRQAMKVVVK
jgi:hypothetical protein